LPRPHLVVVGHLPIAEALSRLGRALDYEVTVMGLDVAPNRFPGADRVLDRLNFSSLKLTPHAYVVVATHGNYDEDALEGALRSDAAYVALVASQARAQSIRQYLRESGLPEEALARLKAPAGLDLGALTPEEIALSILAEIVQLRRRTAGPSHAQPPAVQPLSDESVCGMLVDIATARTRPLRHRFITFARPGQPLV
jgi:xanthine dehydrogenase accessory factor